jgi:rhodanese-related sulfurtransferase
VKRRRALSLLGAGILGGLAGCTGGDGPGTDPGATPTGSGESTTTVEPNPAPFEHPGTLETTFAANGDYPADQDPADGYPPTFEEAPPAPEADPPSFETVEVNGETVRLAPIDVVHAWYRRGEARFADARGIGQYEQAHVYGAVFSSAQRDSAGGGIDAWPTGDRIVTYCGCPHHLSSIRAAGLQKAGHSDVFALDDGFVGQEASWFEQSYPMAGTYWLDEAATERADVTLQGEVDPAYAGEYAWALADRQSEAAPIDESGRFAIHVGFAGVTGRTPVTVRTPEYVVEGTLAELSAGPIRRSADPRSYGGRPSESAHGQADHAV